MNLCIPDIFLNSKYNQIVQQKFKLSDIHLYQFGVYFAFSA